MICLGEENQETKFQNSGKKWKKFSQDPPSWGKRATIKQATQRRSPLLFQVSRIQDLLLGGDTC